MSRSLAATAKLHAVTVDKQESFESEKTCDLRRMVVLRTQRTSTISFYYRVVHASNANTITLDRLLSSGLPSQASVLRVGLWHRHCRQMRRAYDVEGATKDGRKIFVTYASQSISNVLCIVSTKIRNNTLTV